MAERTPVWLQGGTYNAEHDRLVTGMLVDRTITRGGALVGIESGVVPPRDQLQVTSNDTMNITVSPGLAVVPREGLNPPGMYLCYNDAPVTIEVPTQSSSQRNDILVARVNDATQSDPGNNWELALIPGVPNATPTDPEVEGSAIRLARINVRSAALNGGVNRITSSQITDLRRFVSGPGGVHLSWGNPLVAHSPGRLAYDVNGGSLYVSDGTTWDPLYTKKEWETYYSRYRPKADYYDGQISQQAPDTWDPRIRDEATQQQMTRYIRVVNQSPSGAFKIFSSAWGRTDNSALSGHIAVRVADGSNILLDTAFGRGPSFYGTFWIVSEQTFFYDFGASKRDVPLTFTLYFRKAGSAGSARTRFARLRLMVDPVL